MSLISDALNKAQRERAEKAPAASPTLHYPAVRTRPRNRQPRTWPFWTGGVAVLAVIFAAFWFVRGPDGSPTGGDARTANPIEAAVKSETERPTDAPRVAPPPPDVAPGASARVADLASSAPLVPIQSSNEYDLAGMTVVGPNTLLSISRRSDRRSIWIPVGKTIGEITAVSYNPDTDQAVIRVNGRTLSVRMRDSGPGSGAVTQPAE